MYKTSALIWVVDLASTHGVLLRTGSGDWFLSHSFKDINRELHLRVCRDYLLIRDRVMSVYMHDYIITSSSLSWLHLQYPLKVRRFFNCLHLSVQEGVRALLVYFSL